MTVATKEMNGVNVEQLTELIDQVKENRDLANFNFRAKKWIYGAHSRTEIQDFF